MSGGAGVELAREVVRQCVQAGVREVVVCAGARNAALVAVLVRSRGLRLWSFPEERSAAFFALGRALRVGEPVAVVTTSGTAAAELLPATIEAHYQGVPLVLITADRPPRFRGTGAPQAIQQVGLLGEHVSFCCDLSGPDDGGKLALAFAGWVLRQPVHVNVCLEEPQGDELERAEGIVAGPPSLPFPESADAAALTTFLAAEGKLVAIVAALASGDQQGVAELLDRLGCAVLAEATSGLREHPRLASQLLRGGEAGLAAVEASRVLRIGGVPSVRFWRDLEERREVAVFSLTETGFSGLARGSAVARFPRWDLVDGSGSRPDLSADRAISRGIERALALFPQSEPALVRALSAVIPQTSLVFLGNSLPIREWNTFAMAAPRGLRCFANRGANGIDGSVSTFLGLSADEAESWCVVGDLTALYDLAGPWIARSLPPARRRIVIINNAGGRIFSQVKALRHLDDTGRELMENPHALSFRAWADLWGWEYRCVRTATELASPVEATHAIIEIAPDPAQTAEAWLVLGG